MNVDDIIRNAKDSKYTGMTYDMRVRLYESYKHDIADLDLDCINYQSAVRRLADVLGV